MMKKNTDIPFVSNSFLSHFDEIVSQHNIDLVPLLTQVGLEPEDVTLVGAFVSIDKFLALLALGEQLLPANSLPLAMQLARHQHLAVLGPVCVLLKSANSVADALTIIAKHINLVVSGVVVEFLPSSQFVQLQLQSFSATIANNRQFQDYSITLLVNLLQQLLIERFPIRAIHFSRPSDNELQIRQFSQYFACPVVFNHNFLGVTLSPEVLTQPLSANINSLIKLNRQQGLNTKQTLSEQVTAFISQHLSAKQANVGTIASAFGLHQRTLQRQLKRENTDVKLLIDQVRQTQAKQYLSNPYYQITDIAYLLGYEKLSTLSRSCQRWFGVSPSEYRQRALLANDQA